jgi:hypothetical protein
MKHYHVLSGIHGCMPDNNQVCETKKEAEMSAVWWISELRDTGLTFEGSAKSGYYESLNRNYYLEISDCYESDCLDDLDD